MSKHTPAQLKHIRAEAPAMLEALKPFADFAEHLDCILPRSLTDELYVFHNAKGKAAIRLSDCIKARSILSRIDGEA